MAVTAPKPLFRSAVLLLAMASFLRADDSADVHETIGAVATALSSGDAALAMSSFSKSYGDYGKLANDFEALANAYVVENRIDFSDEDVSSASASVTVHWALTLTTHQSGFTLNRNADITLKLARENRHWRITACSPITIFDPQAD